MKIIVNNFNAQASYDFSVGSEVTIRPELSYLYLKYYSGKTTYYDYGDGNGPQALSQYLGVAPELSIVSPALRASWAHNGFKLTGAVRADKTSKPDQWNVSYQAAASYQFNPDNFIRVVYGRAYRATNMSNTSANYVWKRTNMVLPNVMHFVGSTEADLMKTDNIEVGYRWRPTPKLLFDVEAFMSKSTDFGGLMSTKSADMISGSTFNGINDIVTSTMTPDVIAAIAADPSLAQKVVGGMVGSILPTLPVVSTMVYDNLPFKVYQMGVSLNMDWIVSPKVILKLNANVQRTRIDNHYNYEQNNEIRNQVSGAINQASSALTELILGALQNPNYVVDAFSNDKDHDLYGEFATATNFESWNAVDQDEFCNKLLACYNANGNTPVTLPTNYEGSTSTEQTVQHPLTMYYGLKYKIRYREEMGEAFYEACSNQVKNPELTDKFHFKGTPAFYGMLGVICKPMPQLNFSAFCNYMAEREYETTYSRELVVMGLDDTKLKRLSPKFTLNLKVGYKPSDEVEIFFNANNLFNNKTREMVFSDKVGGLYTVGVNFAF